jgi:hypothetical protein
MKKIILSAAFMILTSSTVFAEMSPLALSCTNANPAIKNQLSIISNTDGSEILLTSRSQNSRRGKNFKLAVLTAKRDVLILENAQFGVKVVINTKTSTAGIYDQQGLVATCE